jgi:hypothetical protein
MAAGQIDARHRHHGAVMRCHRLLGSNGSSTPSSKFFDHSNMARAACSFHAAEKCQFPSQSIIHVPSTTQPSSFTVDGANNSSCQPVRFQRGPGSTSVPAADCKLQFPPRIFLTARRCTRSTSYRGPKLAHSNFTCGFNPYELGVSADKAMRDSTPRSQGPLD